MCNLKGWMMLCLAAGWTLQTQYARPPRQLRPTHHLVALKGERGQEAKQPEGSLRMVRVKAADHPAPLPDQTSSPGFKF